MSGRVRPTHSLRVFHLLTLYTRLPVGHNQCLWCSGTTPELYFIDSNVPGPAELLASRNDHL